MRLKEFQEEMSKAVGNLRDVDSPSPKLLSMLVSEDSDPSLRLSPPQALKIYRENISQSLKEALDNHFPLSRLLLGAEYFSHLAELYIESFPCKNADLNFYGHELPAFAASQKELEEMYYLKDFMKLEFLYQEVHYAPEKEGVSIRYADKIGYFQKLLHDAPPEKSYLYFASTARLYSSPYPLLDIWKYCLKAEKEESSSSERELRLGTEAHKLLLYRKEGEVYVEKVGESLWPLLETLSKAREGERKGSSLANLSTGPFLRNPAEEMIQKLDFLLERELLENPDKP